MADAPPPEVDPRRVRMGLVLLTVVVLAALAILVLVDSGVAKLVMVAILVFTLGRTYVLWRSLRTTR